MPDHVPLPIGLFDPKPCTPPAAQLSITGSRPPALTCWEMQGLAATGYRYRNIPDADRNQKLIAISGRCRSTRTENAKGSRRGILHGLGLVHGERLHQGGSHRHGMGHFLAELIGESGYRFAPALLDFRLPELLAPTWSGHGRKLRLFVNVATID
ncbi:MULTISPECIES: hypothetical protein [Rhodobacterales]|uniref:hypothetical protein n=1 Tax=Rhodobacterales TaxID=204455 RepID=UPI001179BB42|nr:hypothetical protein [Pseudooceanicola antarcticus]